MVTNNFCEYDVVIMGAGFAGLCQARHLLLNIPNLKIAIVDPRPEQRTNKDLKIGESMVEIATFFVCKELGLYEYMIENHPPKFGLNFHWSKDRKNTTTIDDYFHIWNNRQPPLASFQMNRAKLESDLLKMNREMGATFYNGRVVDIDLTPQNELKTVVVKVGDRNQILKAQHVVDAAGRKFLIGKKTDNLLFGAENLFGLDTGSAWIRVNNIDRNIFHDGYDPNGATCSHYYGTNHFFGHGHWIWMIPTEKDSQEISIGISYHRSAIADSQINTKEKFYAFLQANHNILYRLVTSGKSIDFQYLPRPAHSSKVMLSPDNWYVIGDAACIFDPFYSLGSSMISLEIECTTEIIRAKLAREESAEKKQIAYNEFILAYTRFNNHLIKNHDRHLGNASIMSWRIYHDYIGWFGVFVPMYVGKWFLDLDFLSLYTPGLKKFQNGYCEHLYQQFDRMAQQGKNLGLMDCYRADQLWGDYHTLKHFDDFVENTKLEPQHCNIFAWMKATAFYRAIWYAKFLGKGYGISAFVNLRNIRYLLGHLVEAGQFAIAEVVYRYLTRKMPDNSQVEQMRREFTNYRHQPQLNDWLENYPAKSEALEPRKALISSK